MRTNQTETGDRGKKVDREKRPYALVPPLLQYLLERAGQLLTKDELMQTVWAETVVTNGALVACIRELRKALKDDAQHPQYLATVHRRGYRFLPAMTAQPVPSSKFQVPSAPPSPTADRKKEAPPSSSLGSWNLKLA